MTKEEEKNLKLFIISLYFKARKHLEAGNLVVAKTLAFEILKTGDGSEQAHAILALYNQAVKNSSTCAACDAIRDGASQGFYQYYGTAPEETFFSADVNKSINVLKEIDARWTPLHWRNREVKLLQCTSCHLFYEFGEYDEGEPFITDKGLFISTVQTPDPPLCDECIYLGREAYQSERIESLNGTITSSEVTLPFSEEEISNIKRLATIKTFTPDNMILSCCNCFREFIYERVLLDKDDTIRETVVRKAKPMEVMYYNPK